jgi:hypothetical protein
MATGLSDDVCNQFHDELCGHCWACAMRRGLIDLFGHPDQCVTEATVFELLDVIHAVREVDQSAERGAGVQQAVVRAAQALTMLVAHVHESVRDE